MAPSLVYETDYARTDSISWLYAIKEFGQCVGCFVIMHVISTWEFTITLITFLIISYSTVVQFMFPVLKEVIFSCEDDQFVDLFIYLFILERIPRPILWSLRFFDWLLLPSWSGCWGSWRCNFRSWANKNVWCRFYATFHCFLNGVSEILRFADRQFYLDWWYASLFSVGISKE